MESPTGVVVSTAEDLYNDELTQAEMEGVTDEEEVQGTEAELSLLASHIVKTFETNKEARKRSGIEDEIFDSLRDYNGEYNPDDLSKIASEGGSSIYMNLTATKSRAAMSWIRDILQSANEDAFSLAPTPIPALPEDINQKLEEAFRVQFLTKTEEVQQGMGAAPSPKIAQETLLSLNRDRRDIKDAVLEEINLEAREQMSLMERKVKDDLKEGGWDQALSNFIEDFCIFPNAFMKGPVITKKDRLRWEAGKPIVESAYTFINKRVAPIDLYPSPTATSIQDGCLIEHLRLTAEELAGLKGAIGYNTEAIDKLLEENTDGISWLNTGIEDERAEEERRGNKTYADEGIFHALHFWGSAKASDVEDWGLELDGSDPNKFVEIEAILVGNEVIKCKLNNDPLKRRPYYKASYQNIPGSFWGRSLPSLMRDIQRMCNACARALANNMGLACLTGDTVVYRHEQNGRAYSEITIKELYDKKDLYSSGLKRTRLRSLDESTGEFYLNKVNGVLYNGHKAVYELKTESGYRVKATEDHRFLKDDGEYDYLMNFLPGDLIAVNGSSNVPTKLCSDCGCPIKPSSQRCKKCHTKSWNEIQRELARDNYWDASHSSSRQRKDVLEARKDYCEICGKVGCKFEVHHKNANPLDNSSENLINLCIACHRTEDAKRRAVGDPYKNRYLTFDKVISIEYVGQEDVYDIQMEAPNHNFVANGFVAHNCGPQIEVYIDRLADAGDIEDIKPLKIWQVTNDPTGASGRAINFFQVPSIANELMGVYDKFEQKADDATGIPRYSYGNEKVGGAAQTASGLSMLLESATKSIKDAIRHIDSGLIIPRVEYQFYWNLIKTAIPYTGDVNVIAHGSDTLTLRGAQQAKRQEFLQITANQSDQDLMGPEGRAELIRELAKDLNLRTEIVPSRLELRKKVEEAKAAQEQAVQQGQTKDQSSLMATKLQVEAQQRMHEQTQQVKLKELDLKAQTDQERATLEREKLAVSKETADSRAMIDSQKMNIDSQTKRDIARTGASVSILQSQNKVQNATK